MSDLLERLRKGEAATGIEDLKHPSEFEFEERPSVLELKEQLDSAVIGQDSAKRKLSLLISLHLTLFDRAAYERPVPNALLIGPTGVGKTFSMRTLSSSFGIPFIVVDTTSLVQSGIAGFQIEDIMKMLYDEAERILKAGGWRARKADIVSLAERGIVFLDEFDKIATPQGKEAGTDSSRWQVQRRLLKMVEGDNVRVGVKHRDGVLEDIFLNTSRLLVIAAGAFADLPERIAGKRRNREFERELFGSDAIVSDDIRVYGFLPELTARLPLVIQFDGLSPRDLLNILAKSADSPLKVWEEYGRLHDMSLTIDPDALAIIASRAADLSVGARGLQQLLFPYLADRFVDAIESGATEVVVSAEDIQPRSQLYSSSQSSQSTTLEAEQ